VTICIAAIAERKSIVTVSDTMISTDYFSADLMAVKSDQLHPDWRVLFAGNDIGRVPSVLARIKDALEPKTRKKLSVREIENVAKKAFQEEVTEKATDSVLSRYQLDMAAFIRSGLDMFGADFSIMKNEIDRVQLGCSFLISGFDHKGTPHIFTVEDGGESANHDLCGFWAIGCGSSRALSALFHHPYQIGSELWKAVYCLCEAKFMAESAGRIGDETIITINHPDRSYAVSMDYEPIKDLWEKYGAPRIPKDAEVKINELMKAFSGSTGNESDEQT
jgi:hypothetical protein